MTKLIWALYILGFSLSGFADTYVDVDAENLNLRDSNWAVMGKLGRQSGKHLKVVRRQGNWLNVIDSSGRKGWIFAKYTTPSSNQTTSTLVAKPVSKSLTTSSVKPTETISPVATFPTKEPKDSSRFQTSNSTAAAPENNTTVIAKSTPAVTGSTVTPTAPATPTPLTATVPANEVKGEKKEKESLSSNLKTSGDTESACIGDPKDPVKVIYLHGWHKQSGPDTKNFRKLEYNNRAALEKMARELHVRIAAPLAPGVNKDNGMQEWNGASLATVESRAKAACGVTKLPKGRTLIGFSSGAFEVNRLACREGEETRDALDENYSQVIAIGMEKKKPWCGGYKNIPRHEFPPNNSVAELVQLSGQRQQDAYNPPAQGAQAVN